MSPDEEVEKQEIGRRYQIALCELAKKENCIVCLPTGSGKTYIALQLIKFYLPDTIQNGKKIIFLANTVALVHQQTNYIRKQLFLQYNSKDDRPLLTKLTGFSNMKAVQKNTLIVVMTAQIFLDALKQGDTTFKEVSLLIFDECHHSNKDQPMAEIMKLYAEHKEQDPLYELPRVLGLTATIITGNSKYDVSLEVQAIEKKLCSRAVTYHDYEEVLRHSTKAEVQMKQFSPCPPETNPATAIFRHIDKFVSTLRCFAHVFYTDKKVETVALVNHPSLNNPEQLYDNSSNPVQEHIKILRDVERMFDEESVGMYGARMAAILRRSYLLMANSEDPMITLLQKGTDACLARVIAECDNIMEGRDKFQQVLTFVSRKVNLLFQILLKWYEENEKKDTLCGIVFCQKRLTAQILTWIFLDAVEHCGDRFKFIKPAFVIGSANSRNSCVDLEEQRITTRKQEETIQKFHKKEVNLIFATSVLEEGLNVPDCNVVIRFDPIRSYPSFVQSMGRARKRGALFAILTSEKTLAETENIVAKYTNFNHGLADHLKKYAQHVDEDDVDSEQVSSAAETEKESSLTIDPSNPESPKITLTGAVKLVHRYCQMLSSDRFVKLEPFSWWEDAGGPPHQKLYKAYVQLPSNAIFREIIEGEVKLSKNLAKRDAFLKVCKRLFELGALDDRLLPRPYVLPEKVKTYFNDIKEQDEKLGYGEVKGATKTHLWYPKMMPNCIENSCVKANEDLTVYLININMIKTTDDSAEHRKLYNFENYRHSLAVLCNADLKDIPPGYLYGRHGVLESNFEIIKLKSRTSLNSEDIAKIKKFQMFLFSKMLKIKSNVVVESEADQLLITALIRDGNGDWDIDWTLLEKLDKIDDEFYMTAVNETERSKAFYSVDNYSDAIVVPWYKDILEPDYYCVSTASSDKTHTSPLDESDVHSKSFAEYYLHKYSLTIMNPERPFLVAVALGKQLNYLTKKKDQTKMSKEERKDHRYSSSIQILVPEFVKIHPLPASIFVQARFLPSILQRTFRLMLGRQIQKSVSESFNWQTATNCNVGRGEVVLGHEQLSNPSKSTKENDEPVQNLEKDIKNMTIRNETMQMLSYANFGQLGSSNSELGQGQPSSASQTSKNSPDHKKVDQKVEHLDFLHPNSITTKHIDSHRSWSLLRLRQLDSENEAMPEISSSEDNSVRLDVIYPLLDVKDIKFKSLDATTDFSAFHGPTADAVMEAITLANAQDALSLESLEVIGDSFLKYSTSTLIFCEFPEGDEGVMTKLRTSLISNRNLYIVGSKKKLGNYLSGGIFVPESSWLPPGVTVPTVVSQAAVILGKNFDVFVNLGMAEIENMTVDDLVNKIQNSEDINLSHSPAHTTLTHSRMENKRIADCVEALIGAYYMWSGIDGALRCMDWLGLQATNVSGESIKYSRCTPPTQTINIREDSLITNPEQLLPMIDKLEDLIQYKFKNRWLVVEAFTHPGYLKNTVTNCYQRLEFLGDAVLDFLITDHIYKEGLAKTPGDLTDLRSALVNNVTFGSLTVRYGFQKFLLSISKQLQDAIDTFASYQEENGHAVTGHFKLLNDLEVPVAEDVEVPKVLGDLFESLAGAVFVDSDMSLDATWKVFYRLMKNEIDIFGENTPKSPVRELNEMYPGIVFRSCEDEQSNDSSFQNYAFVSVKLNQTTFYGRGTNKKNAKQAAAKFALRCLNANKKP